MKQYLPYFRGLVDYDPDSEEWPEFWEREQLAIKSLVSAELFLQFERFPILAIRAILKEHGYVSPGPADSSLNVNDRLIVVPKEWLIEQLDQRNLTNHSFLSSCLERHLVKNCVKDGIFGFHGSKARLKYGDLGAALLDMKEINKRGLHLCVKGLFLTP